MELREAFGSTFLRDLDQPVLVIGSDRWSWQQLASDLGLANSVAARKVSRYCAEHKIRNTKQLYERTSPHSLASEFGLGVRTLWVIWQAFRAKGLDPETWYQRGADDGLTVTYVSYKHRVERRRKHETRKNTQKRSLIHESESSVQRA
jgi:hypothetical protein